MSALFRLRNVFPILQLAALLLRIVGRRRCLGMRKLSVLLGLTLLAVLILLPVTRCVNTPVGNPVLDRGSLQADGTPLPPFPPKKRSSATTIVADGAPVPPFPPKKRSSATTIVADGAPSTFVPAEEAT